MDALLDCGVLRRQAKSIEAHGMQHVVALHAPEPGVRISGCHGVPMADVHVAGGVRVHGQLVPLGAGVVVPDSVQAVSGPPVLPLSVNRFGVPP